METLDMLTKITKYKTWSSREKIDALLQIDCAQYSNLGSDSTKKEREDVKKNSRKIYQAIKEIDYPTGKLFLEAMDSNKTIVQ